MLIMFSSMLLLLHVEFRYYLEWVNIQDVPRSINFETQRQYTNAASWLLVDQSGGLDSHTNNHLRKLPLPSWNHLLSGLVMVCLTITDSNLQNGWTNKDLLWNFDTTLPSKNLVFFTKLNMIASHGPHVIILNSFGENYFSQFLFSDIWIVAEIWHW